MLGYRYNQDCSAARTLELVGERWSLLILRDAMFRRYTRFSQFEKSLGVATNILTRRLDRFLEAGLMQRDGEDYVLTRKGMELKPVLIALTEWGDKWLGPGPVVFETESDGRAVNVQLRRKRDGARVAVEDVVAKLR